jgi:hypothetical protein
MTIQDRIALLELELAELKKAAGKTPHVVPPQPVKDEGVRITLLEERSNFVRPTNKELRELYAIVCSRYPQFTSRAPSTSR